MRFSTRQLAVVGFLGAMTCVATLFLRVPGPFGYYHLGDGIIYLSAVLFGPVTGALVGAIGSGSADIIGGYAAWFPWTFVIKGVTGYVVGTLAESAAGTLRLVLSMALGAILTIVGYGIATYIMYSPEAVPIEIYGNIVQTGTGIIIGILAVTVLRRSLLKNHNDIR